MADDDALMDRFEKNSRRFNARDAIITVFVCAIALILINGNSMKNSGERLKPGVQRSVVLAVAKPSGWLADLLPLHTVAHDLTKSLSPDQQLASTGGFDQAPAAGTAGQANQVPLVTADSFTPESIGLKPAAKKPLKTLLVTGDSLSQPLDEEIARDLADKGVKVIRDAKLGSGISKTDLVDWGRLSVTQKEKDKPDAVIMFMGANEGFSMKATPKGKDVNFGSVEWATIYANRARQMMNTYRAGGTHIYWLTIPGQRQKVREKIAKVVNTAIDVAAQPYRSSVSIFDTRPTFTPNGYRDSMDVNGKETIVRRDDGIHLNPAGAKVLAGLMLKQLALNYDF